MKKYILISTLLLISTIIFSKNINEVDITTPKCIGKAFAFSKNINEVDTLKIYLIKWNKRRGFAIGFRNFKEYYEYYFETNGSDLYKMFDDYEDCINKLTSSDTIPYKKATLYNSLVEIQFKNGKIVEIYFDIKGHYFFQRKWYKMNNDLYYLLFKYFSNYVVPGNVLKKTEKNYKGGFWYDKW